MTSESSGAAGKRMLVLHFDINKTVIICDPVKGVGCDSMISALLSEACWGMWDMPQWQNSDGGVEAQRSVAKTWKYQVGPTIEPQADMITYGELLEEKLKMAKAELQELKNTFVHKGQPGEAVHGAYTELQKQLCLPEGVTLPNVPKAIGEGRYFLLPSFLRLIARLEEEKRDFRLVFRTFGIDIPDVINEFNLFCSGKHPCFPDVPAAMSKRVIALPRDSAEYFRDDAGLHLAMCSKLKNGAELVAMEHGFEACANAVKAKLFDPSAPTLSIAIRDCFAFWRKNKEADTAGKPLLVEPVADGAAHHIFFDDNIERDRAHIVDARSAVTGEPLPFAETLGLYLIKAEPILAIKDPDYFIKAVGLAEQKMSSQLREHKSDGYK